MTRQTDVFVADSEKKETFNEADMNEMVEHMVHNVTSPSTLQNIIKKLSLRLNDLWDATLGVDQLEHLDERIDEHNTDTFRPWHVDHLDHQDPRVGGKFGEGGGVELLHPDTVILIVSCIIMIVVGLLLRKVFLYFTYLRQRRERYEGGLRQLAEHMHVVTHTMSSSPSTPTPVLKLRQTPSLTLAQLKMNEPDISDVPVELEKRRLSKMHNFLTNEQ